MAAIEANLSVAILSCFAGPVPRSLSRKAIIPALFFLAGSAYAGSLGSTAEAAPGITEIDSGTVTCDVEHLAVCLDDPRAGALREFVRRLGERKVGSVGLVGDWFPSGPLASTGGRECLVRYGGDREQTAEPGPGLRKAVVNASQVVRLEVQRVRTVLTFEAGLQPGPNDPVYIRAGTYVDADVASFHSSVKDWSAASPGESVWVFEPTHRPIEVAGQLLCSDVAVHPVLAAVDPGETLFLLPQIPRRGLQRQASKPYISVETWANVVVFSVDGVLEHLPEGLDDAKASAVSPESFQQAVDGFLAAEVGP